MQYSKSYTAGICTVYIIDDRNKQSQAVLLFFVFTTQIMLFSSAMWTQNAEFLFGTNWIYWNYVDLHYLKILPMDVTHCISKLAVDSDYFLSSVTCTDFWSSGAGEGKGQL